jgi:Flp pilus assembly CpaE family ATPase
MLFVLNRSSNLAGLTPDDVSTLLGTRAIVQIPTGGPEVTQAVNEGRPLVLHQPKSPVVRGLQTLADQVRQRVVS